MKKVIALVLVVMIVILPLTSFGSPFDAYMTTGSMEKMDNSINTVTVSYADMIFRVTQILSYMTFFIESILLILVIVACINVSQNGASKKVRLTLIILSSIFLVLSLFKLSIIGIILSVIALVFAIQSKKLMDSEKSDDAKSRLKTSSILLMVLFGVDLIMIPLNVVLMTMLRTAL